MSNGFNSDQDPSSEGPDLGSNCLQRLSADDKSPLAKKELDYIENLGTDHVNSLPNSVVCS